MGKLLFWLIVIFVGLLTARLLAQQAAKKSRRQSSPHAPRSTRNNHTSEALVRCTHCGIHLPRSQAVLLDDQIWCSQEHARQHAHEHANRDAR